MYCSGINKTKMMIIMISLSRLLTLESLVFVKEANKRKTVLGRLITWPQSFYKDSRLQLVLA